MELAEAAACWARDQLGLRVVMADPRSWHHSESGGRVIRLGATQGGSFALKLFGPGRSFAQARAAHRSWQVGRRELAAPVLAWADGFRASLMRWWPQGDGSLDNRALHAIGALLGRLHATPIVDDDPVTLTLAFAHRLDALLQKSETHLGEQRKAWLRSRSSSWAASWEGERVACHRDPRPSNCLLVEGQWRLIDFEHARTDAYVVDLAAAYDSFGTESFPSLIAGYSEHRELGSDRLGEALEAARVLRALQSLVWDAADPARRSSALERLDAVRRAAS